MIEKCNCGRQPEHTIDRRWVCGTHHYCVGCDFDHGIWCTRPNFTLCPRSSNMTIMAKTTDKVTQNNEICQLLLCNSEK
jgi:hypothetical protein